jgi:hypothetical protein
MRLGVILSSQFLTNDLSADFGKIVPCDLPLANQPLSLFQTESLSDFCDKIVFTLPEGYSSKWIKNEVIYCPFGLTLKDVINFVVSNLTNSVKEILFYFGDTLLEIEYSINTIFTGTPNYSYPTWHFVDKNQVFAGAFCIFLKDLKEYLDRATDTKSFLSILSNNLQTISAKNWFDFGNYSTYYNSKKRFLESRSFNSVKVSKDSILTKHSDDYAKMFYEFNWLKHYSNILPASCPTPKNFILREESASYDIEYFALPTLSDLFIYGLKNDRFWTKIIHDCSIFLKKLSASQVKKDNQEGFYFSKVIERKEYKGYNRLEIDNDFINSQLVLAKELDKHDNKLVGGHGDFCFGNLLFDTRTSTLKVIDPRGYLKRKNGQSLLIPKSYDIFKLAHSLIANYDFIIATGKIGKENDSFINDFERLFSINRQWLYAGLSHLFFTMIPLHDDRSDRQQAFKYLTEKYYADYSNCREREPV